MLWSVWNSDGIRIWAVLRIQFPPPMVHVFASKFHYHCQAVFHTAVPPVSLQQTYWESSSGEEKNIKEYEAVFLAQFQTLFDPE